jgi:flagellar biosynthesis GTPase FlhF
MRELEELIAEIKNNGVFEPLEFGFLQTKAKGIGQLIELFRNNNIEGLLNIQNLENKKIEQGIESPSIIEKETIDEDAKVQNEIHNVEQESAKVEIHEEKTEIEEQQDDVVQKESLKVEEIEEEISEKEESVPVVDEKEIEAEKEVLQELIEAGESDEVELQEAEEIENNSQVLGDKFTKEKSVNDLITEEGEKLEHKLSRMPVRNIRAAIGINDRFLFTRELFEGNGDAFNGAVNKIDDMKSIKEAVAFLRDNFKWKKNETSLKFVDLVKRRFINE